jgi:hypothetical protein
VPSQLLATKSIAELHEQESSGNQLRRALTGTQLTLLGIGGVIGTGIFVLTGVAAAQNAGPALPLSFIVAGLGCTFAGLCYAEFAAMIPVSGSAYSYSYMTLGEGIAWFIGWNLVLEYLFAVATVSVGWSGYAISLLDQLHIHIPPALSHAPLDQGADALHLVRTGAIINLPAILIVAAIATICYIGIKQSASFNSVIVTIKVTVIVLFILFGVGYINTDNWHPFVPPNAGSWGVYGPSGVLAAAGVIFFAYIGFDAISTAAQEAKNPQRDMPIGILASLVICTILYVLVSAVLTGMVSYRELNVPAPVALARNSRQAGCGGGHDLRDVGHDHRPGPYLLRHGARRPAAAMVRPRSSALPHAFDGHGGHRLVGRTHRRPVPGGSAWPPGFDWHPGRLRDRMYRNTHTARDTSGAAAPIPHAVAVVHLHCRRARVRADDGVPGARDVDSARCVDGDRRPGLRLLRLPSQLSAQGRERCCTRPPHRLRRCRPSLPRLLPRLPALRTTLADA